MPASMLLLFAPGAAREGCVEGLQHLADAADEQRVRFFAEHESDWV
ncbi:MAG: hypothetical protein M3211_06340 [Actinomycetota bacterium]|nr:hypothetical protein [Actinomycetota bacterium]